MKTAASQKLLDVIYGEGQWGPYDSFARRTSDIEEEARPINSRYFARLVQVLPNPYKSGTPEHAGFEECRLYMKELLDMEMRM